MFIHQRKTMIDLLLSSQVKSVFIYITKYHQSQICLKVLHNLSNTERHSIKIIFYSEKDLYIFIIIVNLIFVNINTVGRNKGDSHHKAWGYKYT